MTTSRKKDSAPAKLANGEYVAKPRDATYLKAALNGHASIWPAAKMVIADDIATFFKDGVEVWNCNAAYASHHFDNTPMRSTVMKRSAQ
ncbi:hypothetical protein [Pseudomonas putida]|uniref:Uncharacterized protein n=1 Tax=Pseudomonas putida TaxID=303 RepID=A0A8I1ECE6_PSEPU|nr:hypothetical protein [Pseudomonas putida]MBI6883220.1 hypothetical protein [Pseudomonas putida]